MDNPPASTWDNLFYPPDLNDYTYFRQPMTDANAGAWMADAAVLAYARSRSHLMDHETFRSIFIRAGFEDAKLIQRSDVLRSPQMYFAHSPDLAILGFCGTVNGNLQNLLTDFEALAVNSNDPGTIVHGGFSNALDIVWADAKGFLEAYREQKSKSRIYFTGHSLGGALATLAIWRFQEKQTDGNVSLYTIGCPRVGNQRFCDELIARASRGIFRYMDGNDLVTHVPPAGTYAHPDFGIHIGSRPWQLTDETLTILKDADEAVLNEHLHRAPPEDLADHSPVRYLYYLWKSGEVPAHDRALAIAGFKSDEAEGDDQLDIGKEVEALCMVLAARDIEPPISLGLFGDWGSGKSFFMKKMEDWFKRLKIQNQHGSPYCSNIIQLKFNAWHYSDTNLWASLTAAILQGLAQALSDKDDPDSQYARASLEAKKEEAQTKLTQAELERSAAEAEVRASEQRLQRLETTVPPEHIVREAFRAAVKETALANQVQAAAKELGVPQAEAAAENLKNELLEVKSLWETFALMLRSTNRRNLWLLCAAVVLLISVGIPVLSWAKSKGLGERIASATGMLVASAALIERVLTPAMRAKKLVDQIRRSAQEVIDKEQQAKKDKAEEDHRKLEATAANARQKVEAASAVVSKIEQHLDELRPDRQMTDFIRQRFQSADYTSQLGVISRARKDFEQLTTLLAQVRKLSEDELKSGAKQELLLPRIDRIILYIDDLDRCPEAKVVDVLQAVHLLLAFKLFVVVVGVDPKWLLHSLTQHTPAFREARWGDTKDSSEWKSTPLNYLEKIFQIPFTLRPMEKTGFGKLVDSLTGAKDGVEELRPAAIVMRKEEGMPPPDPDPAKTQVEQVGGPGAIAVLVPTVVVEKEIPMDSESLRLENWERECMKKLDELIPSPRAAKRFVNVYRLLRSTVANDQRSGFIGGADSGLHRPVMLLLAILTGYPAEATEILRAIIEGRATTTFWTLIDAFEKHFKGLATAEDAGRWHELFGRLRRLRPLVPENQQCAELVKYARQVARYSFQSGRILLTQVNAISARGNSELIRALAPIGRAHHVDGGVLMNTPLKPRSTKGRK
jgi:hypothetical protein